jgi:vacuolar-type H+-ATPase catalytic subunit A/Vma1
MYKKAESRLAELDEIQYEATRKSAEATIRETHPDFDTLRKADEFHDWAEAQPKWVQDAIYENADDPASVVRVIDLYKVDKGLTKTAKKASKKAAASLVSKNSKANVDVDESSAQIRESEVSKMSAKEFEKRQDEINQAMRSGKFIYDITGNAR